MTVKQCTELQAKVDFQMKMQKGRPWSVKVGQLFWVTSSTMNNIAGCKIDRKGKGYSNSGVYLTNQQIQELFNAL